MKNVKKLITGLLLLVLTLSLAACNSSSKTSADDKGIQKMTIKISHVVAENTPKQKGALAMKDVIEKESDGKIKVQVYPNSQLFGDKDEYQNLVANNAQFIIPDMSKLVGNDPGFNIPAMPFLFESDQAADDFWDGEKGKEIFKRLEKDGVLGLSMWPNGAKHITNDKKPITKPEDLQGMKIRTQGGQLLESLYKTLGAGSTSIPFGELYTALQQGTVDGEENTYSNIESKKFDEVQKYTTDIGHTRVDYALLTNTKFWGGLNDETKAIIQKGIEKGTKVARKSAAQLNKDAEKKMEDRGKTKVTKLTSEQKDAFKKALEPVYKEWAKKIGPDIIKDAESRK
ncbi:DctP family TRAP transporter solute-binding subunit [Fictibacillus enclensis]|uniref:DctP family TRAP transporter solute-binding subunit n=1 Tax=Fictibacillus enclensis TaxID=1017270 RepID=UPI0025A16B08|nr:DctP family TRAP transporter solute-binding subunit [Fictibacillus enclensis]MDM5200590.1 DctP family TRAP transporter solute-binding subunit [Fictibacillus enclensis]